MKPNVVYIFPDQHGAPHLGCYGNQHVSTPCLDRLAAEGTRFDRCYSSAPVCTPYRGVLFTGRYPCQTGVVANQYRIPQSERTLAQCFNEGDYHTAYVGKWHLGGPPAGNRWVPPDQRAGFQDFTGWESHHVDHWKGQYFTDTEPDTPILWDDHETDGVTDLAIDKVRGLAASDSPFVLFVAYQAPHPPCAPPDDYRRPMQPQWLRPNVPGDVADYNRPDWGAVYSHQEFVERYYGEIAHLDAAVGRLVDAVDRAGLRENTHIIYTSDHGELMGSHGLYGKGLMYEESAWVPLIIRGPGVGGGDFRQDLFGTVDFLPTLLSLCDLPESGTDEGIDQSKMVRGHSAGRRQSVIMQNQGLAVVRERHKLIADEGATDALELYDLVDDPYEMTNRVDEGSLIGVRDSLLTELSVWLGDVTTRVGELQEANRPSPYFRDRAADA